MDDVDREGAEYDSRRFRLLVGTNMASQKKIDFAQLVVTGVISPHISKDISNGVELLLDEAFTD